jgi:hypothetical protein
VYPEVAFGLACFLTTWAGPDPLVTELAELSADGTDQGGHVVAAIGHWPGVS